MFKLMLSLWIVVFSLNVVAVEWAGAVDWTVIRDTDPRPSIEVKSSYDKALTLKGVCATYLWSLSANFSGSIAPKNDFAFSINRLDSSNPYWELQNEICSIQKPNASSLKKFAHERELIESGSTFAEYLRKVALIEELSSKLPLNNSDIKRLQRALTEASWLTYYYGENWFSNFNYFFPQGRIEITLDGAHISAIEVDTDLKTSFPAVRLRSLLTLFPRLDKFRFTLGTKFDFRNRTTSYVILNRAELEQALKGVSDGEGFFENLSKFPVQKSTYAIPVAKW